MAKKRKSFKSLPKRSKAAAFAKMSTAGKLKKKNKQGKRTGAAISAKGASSAKPKITSAFTKGGGIDYDNFGKLTKKQQQSAIKFIEKRDAKKDKRQGIDRTTAAKLSRTISGFKGMSKGMKEQSAKALQKQVQSRSRALKSFGESRKTGDVGAGRIFLKRLKKGKI